VFCLLCIFIVIFGNRFVLAAEPVIVLRKEIKVTSAPWQKIIELEQTDTHAFFRYICFSFCFTALLEMDYNILHVPPTLYTCL
jgi:hypothetical protein